MSFSDAIRSCFSKYATFSGRASRPEYWWFVLFLFLGGLAARTIDGVLIPAGGPSAITGLFQLATLLPLLAVGWRRMHDTGRPGWMIFLPMIVSVAFIFFAVVGFATGPNPTPGTATGNTRFVILGLLQLVATGFILWWLTRPSDPGENAYGPNPQEAP